MLQNRKTEKMVFRNYRKFADVIKVQVVFALQDMGWSKMLSRIIRKKYTHDKLRRLWERLYRTEWKNMETKD